MLDIVIMIVFLILGIVHHDQNFFYIAGIFALASSIVFAGEKIADAIKGDDITVVHPNQLSLFDDEGNEFDIPEDIQNEMREHVHKVANEIEKRMKQGKDPGEDRSDRC